jgi:hypothetical protein
MNAPLPIAVTVEGMVILVNPVFWNAVSPMDVNLSPHVMVSNLLQFRNALIPMDVTLPREMDTKAVQPWNA